MAVSLEEDDETIIEERNSQMTSLNDGKPYWRNANFLKPSSISPSNQAETLSNPPNPNPTKPISPILKSLSSKVQFHGWKTPTTDWSSWVEKLRPLHEKIWKKSNIYEAIMGSKHEIPKCRQSIFAIAEKWCSETNTFVFSWGEATITLEDVMVLGGLPVTGDSVLGEISSMNLGEISKKKLLEIEENLLVVRSKLIRTKSKKASQQQWMDIWMGKGSEFEHEAFLCFWLSRYVLPADDRGTMNKCVFLIAVILATGNRIALAPAVLACIYRDLRLLKEKIVAIRGLSDHNDVNVTKLFVYAPLQLLQAWFWERFSKLRPKPNFVVGNVCRLVRWSKVKIVTKDDVGLALDSASDHFQWRPYPKPLNHWLPDIDLQSYVRCIRVSQLVGLDCIEPYFPHRVAMQFGLDQDIPISCPRLSVTNEDAWSNYNRPIGDIKLLCKPPNLLEAEVTTRYLDWWRRVVKGSTSFEIKMEGDPNMPIESRERIRIKLENNAAEVPPGFSPKGKGISENNVAEIPPGFTPNGKRVLEPTDDSSHEYQTSNKKSRQSQDLPCIDIGSSDSNSSQGYSSRIEVVKIEDDSDDDDDDHRTLSQLFAVNSTTKANRSGSLSSSHRKTPSSSAGDNTSIQEIKPAANSSSHVLPTEEYSKEGLDIEDGIESKATSPIRSPISIDKNDAQAHLDVAHEFSDFDLVNRIDRLQRIINVLKAAKISQT